jgi:hypothetical protein
MSESRKLGRWASEAQRSGVERAPAQVTYGVNIESLFGLSGGALKNA